MPELPEVETVVREVAPRICGRRFDEAFLIDRRLENAGSPALMQSVLRIGLGLLPGRLVERVSRRGKFIIIHLSGNFEMIVHLRMTGMLLFDPSERLKKFIRVEFRFEDGLKMFFSDIRRFGRIWVGPREEVRRLCGLNRLGVDPLAEPFSLDDFLAIMRGRLSRRGRLKSALLDQSLVAGIGNIYADEICFRARLHPASRLEKLRPDDLFSLHEAIGFCLREGIAHNGTTISDFVGTRGDAGKHQQYLQIYGRTGDGCYACGETVLKTRLGGRGTHFCPSCQTLRK
jgi:formamidopyrimidine-DNA glycosylase